MGIVIGANLKFQQPLRQGGLRNYLETLMGALPKVGERRIAVRVFPHDVALWREAANWERGAGLAAYTEAPEGAIEVGVQDIHPVESGSFTRAPMSPEDVRFLRLRNALGGHSETVVYFGVTDADVAQKLDAALRAGIHMTVCLGVMPNVEASGRGREALAEQVRNRIVAGLGGASQIIDDLGKVHFDIAWEPVAAIKGFADLWGVPAVPPSDESIVESHAVVRQALSDAGHQKLADRVAVSYGGSASPGNAGQLLELPGVDGLLVGTASWDVNNMIQMCQIAERLA